MSGTSSNTTHTAPVLIAAKAVADVANQTAGTSGAAITCQAEVRLTPRYDSMTGATALPSLVSVPMDDSIEASNRSQYEHTIQVTLVYMVKADTESDAMTYMDAFADLVHSIIAAHGQGNVKFIGADIDSFDFDMLSDAGILATQASIRCMLWAEEVAQI